MKISIFSAFYPFRGGIAQFNTRLVEELKKTNSVQCFTFKKQYPNFLFPGKTQFVDSTEKDTTHAQRIVSTFNPFSYFSAAKAIKNSQPELFITNYWMTFFGPFMGFIAKRLKKNVKKIAILHNLVPHEKRFFDGYFNRYFVKNYDGFVVLSDAVKNDLIRMKPSAKILRIEHPLYDHFGDKRPLIDAKTLLGLDPTKKTLLFFGIIRDYKGLDNLIKAMELLLDDYQLVIAGEVYGNSEKYTELINSSSKKTSIFFFNQFIADNEVTTYFSAADLCVLPYRTATQSGVTAIAHYFKLPVLATNVGGLKETIQHLTTGYIIEHSEPTEIAEGITDFFLKSDTSKTQAAFNQLTNERSWENFAQQLLSFSAEI